MWFLNASSQRQNADHWNKKIYNSTSCICQTLVAMGELYKHSQRPSPVALETHKHAHMVKRYALMLFCFQAAGIRLGTLVESLTGMLCALAIAFAYSWIMAFLVLAFVPVIIISSALHFNLSAGSTRRTNRALKESTEVGTVQL